MSHTVTIATRVRDPAAVAAACNRLKLPPPEPGRHRLFADEFEGLAVRLPGWTYPVVCQTHSGELRFDDFGGKWGNRSELDRFIQAYSVEKARFEARKAGHTVTEQSLPDGSIKLLIRVGGQA